jgi:hypothetical protein
MKAPRTALTILSLICLIVFFSFVTYDYLINEPKAVEARKVLEDEINRIFIMPRSTFLYNMSSNKTQDVLVSKVFSTTVSFSDIYNYYDSQLLIQGWKLVNKHINNDPGNNDESISVSYCKSEYTMILRYRSPPGSDGWVYALDMRWWIRGCHPIQ